MPLESIGMEPNTKNEIENINDLWDKPYDGLSLEGRSVTLREYFSEISKYYDDVFKSTNRIFEQQKIPEGKYILFIDATNGAGLATNPALKKVEDGILKELYKSETGNEEIKRLSFQVNNMRYCLGIPKNDKRFKHINAYNLREEIPSDYEENCVGVVSSGSGADVLEEKPIKDVTNLLMKTALSNFLEKIPKDIPKFGICFSAQLMANVYSGAEIDFIYSNKNEEKNKNDRERKIGVHQVFKTIEHDFLNKFKNKFFVGKNHGQEIVGSSILPHKGEILATNMDGKVEILNLKEVNAIATQFHPEAGFVRLILGYILEGKEIPEDVLDHVFNRKYDHMREAFFGAVLQTIGEHLKAKK